MTRQTRSNSGDSAPSFIHQNILQDPEKEIWSFDSAHLSALKTSGIFPQGTVFRPFGWEIRSDMVSNKWLCFNTFPFTLGLRFPFSDFITEFFHITKNSFSQTMSMLWLVLLILDRIKNTHIPDLSEEWKSKFFFVRRDSIPGGAEYPVKWIRKGRTQADFRKLALPLADSRKRIDTIRLLPEFESSFNPYPASSSQLSSSNMSDSSKVPILLDLDELDSYPTLVNVKKETPETTSSNRSRLLGLTQEPVLPRQEEKGFRDQHSRL
ncbi:hypothetical protein Hanom_Chr11g00990601 [Helianthus anomalus]